MVSSTSFLTSVDSIVINCRMRQDGLSPDSQFCPDRRSAEVFGWPQSGLIQRVQGDGWAPRLSTYTYP